MTLIIGIRCSDGIVMGADGAATLGALGQTTVRQPVKKLTSIENKIIIGVSGPVGLGQRIAGVMEQLWTKKGLSGKKSFEAMTEIRQAIGDHIVLEVKYAAEVAKLIGESRAALSAITHTVMALPIEKKLRLYQFGCSGDPEEATDDLPFVAVGSGQTRADPFLAFLRHVFWKDSLPTVSQGIFATIWSLEHAIRTDPGGVAEPMQLMTLTEDDQKQCIVKDFDERELDEHRQAIREAESHVSKFPIGHSEPPPELPNP